MKVLPAILATVAVVLGTAAASWADEGDRFGQRFAEQNCAWCHGGATFQGYTTAPRLAGQRPEYLMDELTSFKRHSRDNPLSEQNMWGAVQRVNPDVARVVATYIASLKATPARDGYGDLQGEGRSLYLEGSAAANVPACAVCHGPNAEGKGAVPRLGGLSYQYLERRLQEWGQGYHSSAAFPMQAVATQLSDRQIQSIASYLSFVN